jgi:hypothetical protein
VRKADVVVQAAKELDGRWIRKAFTDPRTGKKKLYKGQLGFRGAGVGPHLLRVCMRMETVRQWSELKAAQRLLLPAGETAPARMLALTDVLAAVSWAELPLRWYLASPAGLGSALQQLMPEAWDSRHLAVVASKIGDAYAAAADAGGSAVQCVPTLPAEVHWLLSRVDLADFRHVLEPFK